MQDDTAGSHCTVALHRHDTKYAKLREDALFTVFTTFTRDALRELRAVSSCGLRQWSAGATAAGSRQPANVVFPVLCALSGVLLAASPPAPQRTPRRLGPRPGRLAGCRAVLPPLPCRTAPHQPLPAPPVSAGQARTPG